MWKKYCPGALEWYVELCQRGTGIAGEKKEYKNEPTKPWRHDRNRQQQRSDLRTHLQQYSRTQYRSDAHEAIHAPSMYYSSRANFKMTFTAVVEVERER